MSITPEQPAPSPPAADAPGDDGPSRRAGLILVVVLALVGLGMVGLTQLLAGDGGASEQTADGDAAGAPQTCDPTPDVGGQGLGGLEVPEGPEALVLGVMCAFDDDSSVPVADYLGGQPLVINFWATWCEPCRAEMPDFQAIHEAADGRITLLGINHQDAPRLARDFVDELGITYPMLRDPSGRYLRANGGFGMPTTLFVAPDGQIRYRQTGPLDAEGFAELLEEHFAVEVTVAAR